MNTELHEEILGEALAADPPPVLDPADVKPGIYYDMPASLYHAIPALSQSGMKHLAISPLRYWHAVLNKSAEDEEETKALRLGTALHCGVVESEETFDLRYAQAIDPSQWDVCLDTVPQIRAWCEEQGEKAKGNKKDEVIQSALSLMRRTGKQVKILALEQRAHAAANEGKIILPLDQWRQVIGMTRALRAEKALQPILKSGRSEVSIVVREPETGILMKCRIDWMAPKHTVDFKTFTQTRGKSIDKSIADAIYYERYWVQVYFYDMLRRMATGEKPGDFDSILPFVESQEPHEVRLKSLQPRCWGEGTLYWDQARLETQTMIRTYADCLDRFGSAPWRSQQDIDVLSDEDIRQFAYN